MTEEKRIKKPEESRPLDPLPPRIVPLGDQAALVYLADEASAVAFARTARAAASPWLQDIVPAYASVGVFFDADRIGGRAVLAWLEDLLKSFETHSASRAHQSIASEKGLVRIPVCYEMQSDMARVCEHTGLSADDVIRSHSSLVYTVYAIGFVPGFPYLGYLPPELCGVGRLASPRLQVQPGSVGLTGRQTGIYPLLRPGGWNLIGRTPRVIVDVAAGFFPLRVGDCVKFERIDEKQYREEEGERVELCR